MTALVAAVVLLGVQHLLWPAPSGVIVQGALVGGLTALVSLGIALVYRANRIVNFAQGDLGAFPASLAVLLIVSTGVNYFVAMATGIGAALLLGAVVELVVIRRFRRSSRLVLTVATIGLAQVLAAGGLLLPQWFNVRIPPQNYPAPFHASITIGGTTFGGNDVIAMAAVPLLLAALGLLLRRTTVGTAIRAAADDPDRAALLGINVGTLQTVVWVIATVLSSVALFLRAGVVGLPIGSVLGPGVLLRALAAAVIGRMDDLPVIVGAAVGLGIVEQAVVHHSGQAAYVDPVLFLVILAALLLDRRRRPERAAVDPAGLLATRELRPIPDALQRLPEVRAGRWAVIGAVVALLVALPAFVNESRINLVAAGVIFAIIGLSLVVLTGWGGQASLGQLGFVGVGAAIAGRMTISTHADLIVAVVVAGLAGAVIAAVIGLPALRLGGLELAVTTLAFALATSSYVLNPKYVHWLPTGRVPRQPVLGFIGVGSETRFYYVTLVGLGLAVLAVTGVRRSRTGRALIAVRENAKAARSYGVRATAITLVGFALSGFLAAAAGGLFIHHQQSLGASPYAPAESLTAFTMVVVGGLGSVSGALIGAAYVRGIAYFLSDQYRILASGTGLLFVLWLLPDGLGSLLWRGRDAALSLVARRHGLQRDEPDEVEQTPDAAEAPSPESTGGLLDVGSLRARYGHTPVLFGVDLTVRSGEIVALLGTNGAGKSTLLRAISGLLGVESGRVCLDGADTTGLAAHRLARRGIAHLPGGRGVFASLTVGDNMLLARRAAGPATPAPDEVTFPFMEERWNDRAGDLSGGQQQLLALAMVLLTRPKVLLIDELSLGLAPTAIEELLPTLAARRDAGTAILLVEQSVALALRVADRAYVLEKGRVVFTGSAAELSARPDVLHSIFLAGALDVAPARRSATPSGETVLRVSGATRHYGGVAALQDVSLTLADGEIVGLIGANGAGKTTLLDVVSGFIKVEQGTIELVGRDVTRTTTEQRARFGLGRSFQDARLFPALTVAETVAVALELRTPVRDPVAAALRLPDVRRSEEWVGGRVEELLSTLGLAELSDRFIDELSTGTRRVVDLACLLAQEARVLLLDEPSAGIAQREAEALAPLLLRLRDEMGVSMVVIEHDLRLLTSVADRLIAMDLGRVVAEGAPADVLHDPTVIASYLGTSGAVP